MIYSSTKKDRLSKIAIVTWYALLDWSEDTKSGRVSVTYNELRQWSTISRRSYGLTNSEGDGALALLNLFQFLKGISSHP